MFFKRIDEYACERARFPLVPEVIFEKNMDLKIKFVIRTCFSKIFELRLKKRRLPHVHVSKSPVPGDEDKTVYIPLSLTMNHEENNEQAWGRVMECAGNKLGKVILQRCHEKKEVPFVTRLLEGTKIDKLSVFTFSLTDLMVEKLRTIITNHNVDHLSLSLTYVAVDEKDEKIKILLDFASLVRSMQIEPLARNKYLFDIANADWPAIIIEMFSRKLDKLDISNNSYSRDIDDAALATLRKTLPNLGKKLWFAVTCCRRSKAENYTDNDHLVEVDPKSELLTIKHISRKEEKWDT